jgi:hypothetical protein
MLQTEKIMTFYILQANKYDWLSIIQLDWMSNYPVVMVLHAPSVEVANKLKEKYTIFNTELSLLVDRAPIWLLRFVLKSNSAALTTDAIEKTIKSEDYDKIKIVLDHYRRTSANIALPPFILRDIMFSDRFDLIKRIFDDYSDLITDFNFTLDIVLSISSGNPNEAALKLTERILNLIEEKKFRVYGIAVHQAIVNLDINTVTRLLTFQHLNLDEYKYEVERSYQHLMEHSKTNPDDAITMIKLLDYHYNITQDKNLVIAAAVSLPVLKFLASHLHARRLVLEHASDLLLQAVHYADEDVIKYIIKELGPFDEKTIKIAIKNAVSKPNVVKLLKELLK